MKQETEVHFLVGTVILGFLSNFKNSKTSSPFVALKSLCLWRCQSDVIPLSRWGGDLRLSLGSPQGIQTSLHLVTWNTSLNLSHCKEIRPFLCHASRGTFHLRQKPRVPLTYLLQRENSTWAACGKLAYLFSPRQGISSRLEMICDAWNFLRAAVLKWIFI